MNLKFSNILIYAPDDKLTTSQIDLTASVFKEHDFGGLITSSAYISNKSKKDELKIPSFCSIGFPGQGLDKDLTMNSVVYMESIKSAYCKGFCVSFDKHDLESSDWDSIRSYAYEISSLTEKDIYICIDPSWCRQPEDISRVFSILSNHPTVTPIIQVNASIKKSLEHNLKIFGNMCRSSTTKNIILYSPKLMCHSVILNPQEYGFSKVIISPSSAVEVSREY